ncbi:L,D-transpeptidase family protein [Desulfosoma caldarium]|nr:L,D-transpeptidase family protein [Desulfosoma caldarium]
MLKGFAQNRFHQILSLALVILCGAIVWNSPRAHAEESTVEGALELILSHPEADGTLYAACQKLPSARELVDFYRNRRYAPAWLDGSKPSPWAKDLVRFLREEAPNHGLNAEDYHLACLSALLSILDAAREAQRPVSPTLLAHLDLVLTDAFLILFSHLSSGRVDPSALDPLWVSQAHRADLRAGLEEFLIHHDLRRTLRRFAPPDEDYWRLVAAVAAQRKMASMKEPWPVVPEGPSLRPGQRDSRVPLIRRQLYRLGDYDNQSDKSSDTYDAKLLAAVRRFQKRHGLAVDGVVGKQTTKALNVSPRDRLLQMLANLERLRWLPRSWGDRYLVVNTADYSLTAYEHGASVLKMRVIVGGSATSTPVFSEVIRYVELNPYWNVPQSIVGKELLPKIRKDPTFLERHHYELLATFGDQTLGVDPRVIDWQRVRPENFPWRIRQLPGPWNALGRIKFVLPNRFNVYLHDTPDRHLFQRPHRALSHGCIRLEKPLDLALFVLQDDPKWTRESLEKHIASGKRHIIALLRPCTVHLLYITAWVSEDGTVHFRRDIYDRDKLLVKALKLEPFTSEATNTVRAPHPGG